MRFFPEWPLLPPISWSSNSFATTKRDKARVQVCKTSICILCKHRFHIQKWSIIFERKHAVSRAAQHARKQVVSLCIHRTVWSVNNVNIWVLMRWVWSHMGTTQRHSCSPRGILDKFFIRKTYPNDKSSGEIQESTAVEQANIVSRGGLKRRHPG